MDTLLYPHLLLTCFTYRFTLVSRSVSSILTMLYSFGHLTFIVQFSHVTLLYKLASRQFMFFT